MLIPNRIEAFLEATDIVDHDDRQLSALARRLSLGRTDVPAIRKIYHWVRDEVPHTADLLSDPEAAAEFDGPPPVTCTASEVHDWGTGICYAKSHLLAALLRAAGVPAGFCYQRLKKDAPHEGFELHGLNAVWVDPWRRWVRLDARGNRPALPPDDRFAAERPAIDAQFTPTGTQLAFFPDASLGEKDDRRIFADPLPDVVDALMTYETLDDLWPNLPSELPDPADAFR